MERTKKILDASLLWQALMAMCNWFGVQWRASGLVRWFLHPRGWTRNASEDSIFYKLWDWFRDKLCRAYGALRLDRVFEGSVFLHTWFWCALPAVLAPLLPTMAVLGLAAVGFCSLLLSLVRDRTRHLAWAPINRYVILFAAIYLVGTLFSVDLDSSLKLGLLTVFFILYSLVLSGAITTQNQLELLLSAVVLAGTAASAYGILQYIFGWGYQSDAWVDSGMFSAINFRATSTFENPNMLGQYLILLIPVGGAKLLSAKKRHEQAVWFVCCGVMCICMILTMSRGAWLGLLFAGAVLVAMLNPRLILLFPVVLVVLWLLLPDTVTDRFASIGNLSDASTTFRVYIWMGTLAMLKDNWLCGIGPGTDAFNKVYPAYSLNAIFTPHSHNLFLQIVCDVGIAALIVFLILLFVYFRMMCSAISRERDKTSRIYQIAFTAGVCGFLVQAMTDYSFYNNRVLFFFWAYLAMGALCTRHRTLPEGRLGA